MKKYIALAASAAVSCAVMMTASPAAAQSEPFVGQVSILPYSFCPRGWAPANGQLLAISQYQSLFSLYGTTFGGDGRTTFALPDLRGRSPMGDGSGPGLTPRTQGAKLGAEENYQTVAQMAKHTHALVGVEATANSDEVDGNYIAESSVGDIYHSPSGTPTKATMNAGSIDDAGAGQAENNIQPTLVLHYCVALQGIYPPRN